MGTAVWHVEQELFRREVRAWSLRALVIAAPSALYAALSGFFDRLASVLAILTGVAVYVALVAGLCSRPLMQHTPWGRRVLDALQRAVWIKGAWTLLGILTLPLMFSSRFGEPFWLYPLFLGFFLDELMGGVGIGLIDWLRQWTGLLHEFSFAETLAVTLVQGTVLSLELAVFALAVLGFRAARRR